MIPWSLVNQCMRLSLSVVRKYEPIRWCALNREWKIGPTHYQYIWALKPTSYELSESREALVYRFIDITWQQEGRHSMRLLYGIIIFMYHIWHGEPKIISSCAESSSGQITIKYSAYGQLWDPMFIIIIILYLATRLKEMGLWEFNACGILWWIIMAHTCNIRSHDQQLLYNCIGTHTVTS